MRCNKEDCFHCPYPDCINDKPLSEYVYSDEQKKHNYERIKERKAECRANGICIQCMIRPASDGYRTCAECREKHRRWARDRNHRLGLHLPRECMDGVTRYKICGQHPPVKGQVVCERCLDRCRQGYAHARAARKNSKNGFERSIDEQWKLSKARKQYGG